MYANDSFHTLTLAGQIGLVALSLTFAATTLFTAWWMMAKALEKTPGKTKFTFMARLAIAASFFYLFVWLSPQLYYTYYLLLFDDLPWQLVIKAPPAPRPLVDLLAFQGPTTLSAHTKGVLGWLLFVIAIASPRRQ